MNAKIIIVLVFSMLVISCKDKTEQTVNNDSGLIGIQKHNLNLKKWYSGSLNYIHFPIKFILPVQLFLLLTGKLK